jgi:hypothetical protein
MAQVIEFLLCKAQSPEFKPQFHYPQKRTVILKDAANIALSFCFAYIITYFRSLTE